MTMPDSNSAAESRHAHETAKREELAEDFCEKALEDLVERMMNGEEYPRRAANGRDQINRLDILHECDHAVLASAVSRHLADDPDVLETVVEHMVRNYLRDSKWHERRIEELISESKEDV